MNHQISERDADWNGPMHEPSKEDMNSIQVPRCECAKFPTTGIHEIGCPYHRKPSKEECEECGFVSRYGRENNHSLHCSKSPHFPPSKGELTVEGIMLSLRYLLEDAHVNIVTDGVPIFRDMRKKLTAFERQVADRNHLLLSKREWDKAKQEGALEVIEKMKSELPTPLPIQEDNAFNRAWNQAVQAFSDRLDDMRRNYKDKGTEV